MVLVFLWYYQDRDYDRNKQKMPIDLKIIFLHDKFKYNTT